jgi:predicted amidohydrolase YtcJ
MTDPADLVLTGGVIHTMAPGSARASALASRDGRLIAVGSTADVSSLTGPKTREIELDGRVVIPGLIDAHAHMEREGLKEQRPSLAGIRSLDGILSVVADAAKKASPGEWIVTMPVGDPPYYFGGPSVLDERRLPTRDELDRAAPSNPVYIMGAFNNWGEPPGYSALNSMGLRLNGITRDSAPRCSGIEICKDQSGEPNGIFIETNARPAIEFDLLTAVPRFQANDRTIGLRRSMALYNAAGTTSIYEGHGSSPETIAIYRDLWQRGELSVRASLVVSPTWTNATQARRDMKDLLSYARGQGLGDEWLRISGLFIGITGETAIRDAAISQLPDTGWSGFVEHANDWDDYRAYVMLAAEYGFRVHTIAAHSLAKVLAIWDEADKRFGIRDKRWVVEHVALATADELAQIKALGACVTTIPSKALWKRGPKQLNADPASAERLTPHRAMLDRNIPIAIGTDNIPYSPFFVLWNAVARQGKDGRIVGPGQRVDRYEALAMLTTQGARLSFDENRKGMLAAGMAADFLVLDRDPLLEPDDAIQQIKPQMTVVGGRIVHEI